MTTMVQRSTAYHCAMLRNVGTGPHGVMGGEGEEGGGVVGGGLVAGGEEVVEDVEVRRNLLSCRTLSILPPPPPPLLSPSLPPLRVLM